MASSESTYLLGICRPNQELEHAEESFAELKALADTAGLVLLGEQLIRIREYSAATFFGKGKVDEIAKICTSIKPKVVVVDAELSATQSRNLEELFKTKVIDRTGLILDIFAQHAKSAEGKLQVELAQYRYLLPRLTGAWTHLSKQRGGIGMRGPGETQLEVDRRRVRERISVLQAEVNQVSAMRELHRKKREATPLPTVTLIGYTNAGKSTLFNRLVSACERAENRLFATLDPKTKKLRLPSGRKVLLSDTVGFINNLPHQLVDAFKSTFEEVASSRLLLHVIDSSRADFVSQMEVVQSVLNQLKLNHLEQCLVFNKCDAWKGSPPVLPSAGVIISGVTGEGIDKLLEEISKILANDFIEKKILIPFSKSNLLEELYEEAEIKDRVETEKGTLITAELSKKSMNRFTQFFIEGS